MRRRGMHWHPGVPGCRGSRGEEGSDADVGKRASGHDAVVAPSGTVVVEVRQPRHRGRLAGRAGPVDQLAHARTVFGQFAFQAATFALKLSRSILILPALLGQRTGQNLVVLADRLDAFEDEPLDLGGGDRLVRAVLPAALLDVEAEVVAVAPVALAGEVCIIPQPRGPQRRHARYLIPEVTCSRKVQREHALPAQDRGTCTCPHFANCRNTV